MILFIDPAPAKNIRAGSINSKAGSKIQHWAGIISSWNKKHKKCGRLAPPAFRRTVNNRQDPDFSLICDRIATISAAADRAKI
jgi:hypothetical protein